LGDLALPLASGTLGLLLVATATVLLIRQKRQLD
jgi:hypothetical protein